MFIVYLTLITSLVVSLFHFSLTVSGIGVLWLVLNTVYLSQIDRPLRRGFRFGFIQHEISIQQVTKDTDLRLWKSIMGTPSHPLQDLLPPT